MRNQKVIFALVFIIGVLVGALILVLRENTIRARSILAQTTPHLVSYQGTLSDDGGNPVNGTKDLTITVYASESSVTPLWTEFHDDVEVDNGAFAILLGENTPLLDNLFDDPERWMEIVVDGITLSPRQRFTSVPYALNADKLDGHDATDFSTSDLPSGAIVWFREGITPSGFTLVTDTLPVDVGGWEPMPTRPITEDVACDVWTGSEILCWNGDYWDWGNDEYIATPKGARYDAAANSWSLITSLGAPSSRSGRSAVWTGSEMIVWGGTTDKTPTWTDIYTNTGGRYNPGTDSWTATSTADPDTPAPRSGHGAVWIDDKMMIWGGVVASYNVFTNTGALYDPVTNTWDPVTVAGAPSPDPTGGAVARPAMVWTGSQVIVWTREGGALYDPNTDTWTPMSGDYRFAGSGRAFWTGSEMAFVKGFYSNSDAGSVAYYNPVSDTWRYSGLQLGIDAGLSGSYDSVRVLASELLLLPNGVYYDVLQDTALFIGEELPMPLNIDGFEPGWVLAGNKILIPDVWGHGIMHEPDLLYPYVKE